MKLCPPPQGAGVSRRAGWNSTPPARLNIKGSNGLETQPLYAFCEGGKGDPPPMPPQEVQRGVVLHSHHPPQRDGSPPRKRRGEGKIYTTLYLSLRRDPPHFLIKRWQPPPLTDERWQLPTWTPASSKPKIFFFFFFFFTSVFFDYFFMF